MSEKVTVIIDEDGIKAVDKPGLEARDPTHEVSFQVTVDGRPADSGITSPHHPLHDSFLKAIEDAVKVAAPEGQKLEVISIVQKPGGKTASLKRTL